MQNASHISHLWCL